MKNSRSRFRKFGNVKTIVDGDLFDSKAEAKNWQWLKIRERAGEISDLKRQVTYRLEINGQLICKIIPDFEWTENGQTITADCKGMILPEFRIKAKLFRAIYGRDIIILK